MVDQPFPRLLSKLLRLLLPWGALILAAGPAAGCLVCIEQPEDTLTDRLWDATTVVLARITEEDPFLYRPVETLSGTIAEPIAFVVNSVERRRMAADPDRIAVFLHEPRGWTIGGHGGAEFAAFVRTVLASEQVWSDMAEDPDRIAAFAALHAHPDPVIRRTALTELSRVPYARLRGLEVDLEVDWLAARLQDASWYGWWPILAHLLGLHDNPTAHALVRARALDVPAATRAPWLVALVEIEGDGGIERILEAVSDEEDARAAVRALVAHADRSHELADVLATALRSLASKDPEIAAEALPGLRTLGDMSLAATVAQMLAAGPDLDPATAFVLKSYLATARRETGTFALHATE